MEYLGKCPKCKHNLIIKTIKRIPHSATARLPQRLTKCANCRTVDPKTGMTSKSAIVRATIIGEIVEFTKATQIATEEYDPTLNSYALKIQLWK